MSYTSEKVEELNKSFEANWDRNRGPEQSRYFMRRLLDNLPAFVFGKIGLLKTIIDVGCATGEGTMELKRAWPYMHIGGVDLSDVAIEKAEQRFNRFVTGVWFSKASIESLALPTTEREEQYDVVFCSNVLEHFSAPLLPFQDLMRLSRHLLIVMTPYKEENRIPGHLSSIDDFTFGTDPCFETPEGKEIKFHRVHKELIDMKGSEFWHGEQILQVYLKIA